MLVEANKEYTFTEGQYLFKYIDIHKLIYFLTSENLFFSPLSYFDDPLEGISEKYLLEKMDVDEFARKEKDPGITHEEKHNLIKKKEENLKKYTSYLEVVQRKLFASCWYLGNRESLAMWDAYSNKDSVAIKFKPEDLCRHMITSFENIEDPDFNIMSHGKVEYFKIAPFDSEDKSIKNCGHKYKGFLKDLSYKHEEEFRFLLMQTESDRHFDFFEFSLGTLNELDFTIITHPYMENWKYKNIYNILKSNKMEQKLTKSQIPTRRHVFDNR